MVQLEQFDKEFYTELIDSVKNAKELMQFAGPEFTFPLTEEQIAKSLSDENRIAFRVVNSSDNSTIGHCEIYFKDDSARLGRILIMNKNQRGKGIGEQIVTLLVNLYLKTGKRKRLN